MRTISLIALLSACRSDVELHWEACESEGVSASIQRYDRHHIAAEIYRVGRYLGMDPPAGEAILRICNGTDRPIHLYPPRIAGSASSCKADLDRELDPRMALVRAFVLPPGVLPPVAVEMGWSVCPFYDGDPSCRSLTVDQAVLRRMESSAGVRNSMPISPAGAVQRTLPVSL